MTEGSGRTSYDSLGLRLQGRGSLAAAAVEAMLARLETATDATERAQILVQVAVTIRDEFGDKGQAIDALVEAWRADPLNDAILDHLEPLLAAEDRWMEVLEATRMLASAERNTKRTLAYSEAMVRWLTQNVPQPELARQWVERIRAIDTTHWLVHMVQAADARGHGDLKRELDELDRAVLSARRADDRSRIHLLMASRYREERTLNVVEAKKHYAAASKLFPRAMDPLRGLEQLAKAEGDKAALSDALRRQADADALDDERVAALLRLAAIEEVDFKKPELAARTLERVIAIDRDIDEAWDGLERCYTASRAWSELETILERAATTGTTEVRGARLGRLAHLLESKLGDVRGAIGAYERWLSLSPEHEAPLTELARLTEKLGDVRAAVGYRERLAACAKDPVTRARMYVIAGQLLTPIDGAGARRCFELAAAADASNQAAWNALMWDARAASDTSRAERYLEDRAHKAEGARAKAGYFVDLAELRAKAGNASGARQAWEAAAAADPTNEVAAAALVMSLVDEGRYEEADSLFDVAIAAADRDKDYERMFALRRAFAKAQAALGRPDGALIAALGAYTARPGTVEGKEALIEACLPMRADPKILEAREALTQIAERPDGLSIEARAGLADILTLTGDKARAAALYDDVLAEKPDHAGALAGLSQYHLSSGNAVAALSLKRHLVMGIEDAETRFAALVEIAEAFVNKAKNDELAAEVYEEARKARPKDLPVLHKLLALYQKLARWSSVFDVLSTIASSDTDALRKSKTLYTMAQIAKEELADRGGALRLYDQALDVDPSQLVAFERIVQLLTEDRDWLGLDEKYTRMIDRVRDGGDVKLVHALYKQLAILRRDRLGHKEEAIDAIRKAALLRPDDEEAQAILRELLSNTGQTSGAVAITLERVLRDPLAVTPYAALFDLFLKEGKRDRALAVASAMRFLDIAHAGAEGLWSSFPQPPLDGIVLDLGPTGYTALLHEELDPSMTEIFEVVAPAVLDIALARLPLRERIGHPGPSLKGFDGLGRAVQRAAKILGAPAPRLYTRRMPGPALSPAATRPPSLLVYPAALGGIAEPVMTFLVGKRVCELTPPLLARALCPSITELKALGASAVRIATDKPEAGDMPLKERLRKEDLTRIANAADAAMRATGKLDVLRWSQLADVSASRAGLLLTGDLETARAAIAVEAQAPGDLNPREKMKELVAFYLSDGCAALRERLGVSLA